MVAGVAHPKVRTPLVRQLYFQVVVAIVLGVALGFVAPEFAASLKPLGDAFIKLVKMIIAPVIFLSVATGIAHIEATTGRSFGDPDNPLLVSVRSGARTDRAFRWCTIVATAPGHWSRRS